MRLLLALIAITMAASAGTAKRVAGQGAVKSVYDDWQLRCDTLPGAQHEQCALMQNVVTEDRPNFGISVIVFKTADQKADSCVWLLPWACSFPLVSG